ncbi:MAG: chromate transporter [Clostridia bacterium]|nr:chromate transporter [Clostridia bacterium]
MLFELFFTFFEIGLFTFGGGYAMLPLIQKEVAVKGWLTTEELVNFVAISESTPGAFAINVSTYVGTELAGIPGGIVTTLGCVMPSFIIILIITKCFEKFQSSKIISGCMSGLKPAAIGLIGSAVISIGQPVFFPDGWTTAVFTTPAFWVSLVIFAVMLVPSFKKVHPIAIICISAVLGIAAGYILKL